MTLTGPGGIGKTRLAIEVASEAAPDFAEGVWLVALEALNEGSQVVGQVAAVLGLKEEAGRSLLQTLTEYLRAKRLLLVLDNCEHLLEASAPVVGHLLRECAGVRFLVTSREPLGITGETVWSVPALTVPDPVHLPTGRATLLRVLMGYESVQLFVERAQAVQKTFSLTGANALAVAQICFRLEGLPLALELAAARVKVMPAAQIASRLDDRFGLLTGGSRTALSRQQTLRAALDWSYALLGELERRLLQRLSVFAGGWTLAVAEQVCAGDYLVEGQVLDLLTSLVDKSLVVSEARYRLLETVRQYAAEGLEASGEASAVRARHRDYFLALAEESEPRLTSGEQADWLARLEAERANLRAALDWCQAEKDGAEAGLRLAGALGSFWEKHGDYSEGRALISATLGWEGADGRTLERAKALRAAGMLAFYQRDYGGALSLQTESLAIYRELGDKIGIAWSLHDLGKLANIQANKVLARSLQEEGLAVFREMGDRTGTAWSLHELGRRLCEQGDYAEGRRLYAEGLALFRELGNRQDVASSLHYLGKRLYEQGDYAGSRAFHEEGLALFREMSDRHRVAWSLHELGKVALVQGRSALARDLFAEGLGIQKGLGDRRGAAICLRSLATGLSAQGNVLQSVCLWGASEALCENGGEPIPPSETETHGRQVAQARATLGEAAFLTAWAQGRTLTWEQAATDALGEIVGK